MTKCSQSPVLNGDVSLSSQHVICVLETHEGFKKMENKHKKNKTKLFISVQRSSARGNYDKPIRLMPSYTALVTVCVCVYICAHACACLCVCFRMTNGSITGLTVSCGHIFFFVAHISHSALQFCYPWPLLGKYHKSYGGEALLWAAKRTRGLAGWSPGLAAIRRQQGFFGVFFFAQIKENLGWESTRGTWNSIQHVAARPQTRRMQLGITHTHT